MLPLARVPSARDEDQLKYLSSLLTSHENADELAWELSEARSAADAATASSASSSAPTDEIAAQVAQVQELFPDYGAGFIEVCLGHFNYNSEAVIHHLLEDNLPAELASLDRTLRATQYERERRNVYQGDELDRMTPEALGKLHRGKRYATTS